MSPSPRLRARLPLQEYQQSLNDLQKVLQLDGSIAEARAELEEVTGLLQGAVAPSPAPPGKDKERRKIEIQEVRGMGCGLRAPGCTERLRAEACVQPDDDHGTRVPEGDELLLLWASATGPQLSRGSVGTTEGPCGAPLSAPEAPGGRGDLGSWLTCLLTHRLPRAGLP